MKFNKIALKNSDGKTYREMKFSNFNLVIASNKKGKSLLYDALEVILGSNVGSGKKDVLRRGNYQIDKFQAELVHNERKMNVEFDSNTKKYIIDGKVNNTKESYVENYSRTFFGKNKLVPKNSSVEFDSQGNDININYTQKLIFSFFPETRVGDLYYPFPKAVADLKKRFQVGKVMRTTLANLDESYYNAELFISENNDDSLNKKIKSLENRLKKFDQKNDGFLVDAQLFNERLSIDELKIMKGNIKSQSDLDNITKILIIIKNSYLENDHKQNAEVEEIEKLLTKVNHDIKESKFILNKIDAAISSRQAQLDIDERNLPLPPDIDYANRMIISNDVSNYRAQLNDKKRIEKIKSMEKIVEEGKSRIDSAIKSVECIMKKYFEKCKDSYLYSLSGKKEKPEQSNMMKYSFKIEEDEDFAIITEVISDDGVKKYFDSGSQALKTTIQVAYILALHEYLNQNSINDFQMIVFDSIAMPYSTENNKNAMSDSNDSVSVEQRDVLFSDLCQIFSEFTSNDVNRNSQIIIIDKTRDWIQKLTDKNIKVDFTYEIEDGLVK